MPLTVVVGGFFGDEGKGKVVSYLALKDRLELAVRVGSINAGHTVVWQGRSYGLRMVPSAFVHDTCRLLIGPGANVEPKIFLEEVEETGVDGRVGVDYRCSIIEEEHVERDRRSPYLAEKVKTTGQGVGPAVEDRVKRIAKLAKDIPPLKPYLADVPLEANEALDRGRKVLLEGTQGTFLSLIHGTYPYVTSRDTSASAICSEAGIGPKRVDDVLIVFKSIVTRVGAGPLENELSEEDIIRLGWLERATVTGRVRRAAPFNMKLAKRAVMMNSATQAALTKLDILFPSCRNARSFNQLPKEAAKFIEDVENELKIPITLIGVGPGVEDMIDRRGKPKATYLHEGLK